MNETELSGEELKNKLKELKDKDKDEWNRWIDQNPRLKLIFTKVHKDDLPINFAGYRFPETRFVNFTMVSGTNFSKAEFCESVDFDRVRWTDDVSFKNANFHGPATFKEIKNLITKAEDTNPQKSI